MEALFERAIERIGDFDAFIKRFNGESPSVNDPADSLDSRKPVGRYAVPKEVVRRCEAAVSAILSVLSSEGIVVQTGIARRPPEWWSNLRCIAEDQGLKYATAKSTLIDALDVLERYVGNDTPHLAELALLIGDLHDKVMGQRRAAGFRPLGGNPSTDARVFSFDPQIDGNVHGSVLKNFNKAIRPSEPCVSYLSAALREFKSLV